MPKSRFAHIYATVSGLSYQASVDLLKESGGPFPGPPTDAQVLLEALFVDRLATLRSRKIAWSNETSKFGIQRVEPASNSLLIELERDSYLAHLAESVLPVTEVCSDPHPEVWGIAGLRMRESERGISLYRPGIDAEIIVQDITVDEMKQAHRDAMTGAHESVYCVACETPSRWTTNERWFADEHERLHASNAEAASIVLRRLCFFNAYSPRSIHTWRGHPSTAVVELHLEEMTGPQSERLLKLFASPQLKPAVSVVHYLAPSRERGGYIEMVCEGTNQTVEIRLEIR